ncbi:MAG: maltose alpha-D-glucosyltransferase [Thermodesulfobacteriota bacterium]
MAYRNRENFRLSNDSLWYKDAIIYELHVRAFADSDGDGVGDFKGLIEKLDYLQDLGVTAIWLLPFCASPLKDDGYDISDYTDIHPAYGSLRDFKVFLRESHRRGLRVITELVLNHTSDQHPWFQRARRSKSGSRWRNFYVWSDTWDRYKEVRIIFKDFESSNWSWDPVANAYYWHRFYSHQPDLNYDSPSVRRAVLQAMDFWLELGVDGLRLDAVPYLYEREGTNCENLAETHAFLKEVRRHVDERFKNRVVLAEANQWPEDAAAYFGDGEECHMAFNFPIMPRMFIAIRTEDRFPIIDILEQTPVIPETCHWALFLRNHDELTLEMVTDEERDYMYRVYAHDPQARINLGIRRRLAPLLGNHRRKIELMKSLLFSLPGTPVLYYGDEIGMGDNIYLGDRNGVRTPMQWSGDRNAGFSQANPQRLYLPIILDPEYHYEAFNVEAQQNNPSSLLWWTKRLIALRKRFRAFGRGTLEFLYPENRKVLAFIRRYEDECILVIANLSRFVQCVELDLSALKGMVPVELFGGTRFPPIGELPYFITLGPHTFYWFSIEPQTTVQEMYEAISAADQLPLLTVAGTWWEILHGDARADLEKMLPDYLKMRRWFRGKARRIRSARILEDLPIANTSSRADITLVQVDYVEGDPEIYLLPITFTTGEHADHILKDNLNSVIARIQLRDKDEQGILYDALVEKDFCDELLQAIARGRHLKGTKGELVAKSTKAFRSILKFSDVPPEPSILKAEQSNTSVVFKDRFILKLFRSVEGGINPDLEIGLFLTEKSFPHVPPVAGALQYRQGRSTPMTLGILHGFVFNQGNAWEYTQDILAHYFEHVLARRADLQEVSLPQEHLLDLVERDFDPLASEMIGAYLESARILGQRTAELHLALASLAYDREFAPEAFSTLYQRSLYQSMRTLTKQIFELLRRGLKDLPVAVRGEAQKILDHESEVIGHFQSILNRKISAMRIRCHGDYHLGQVLYTGKDFVIFDFEGEPARPLSERRLKRSPLRDVAGILRSFHYAAYAALFSQQASGFVREEDLSFVERWGNFWYLWVCVAFLKAYLPISLQASIVPRGRNELQVLLNAYLLEKAIYELGYELNNRPNWLKIPLQGIQQQLGTREN